MNELHVVSSNCRQIDTADDEVWYFWSELSGVVIAADSLQSLMKV